MIFVVILVVMEQFKTLEDKLTPLTGAGKRVDTGLHVNVVGRTDDRSWVQFEKWMC